VISIDLNFYSDVESGALGRLEGENANVGSCLVF
jgi:hypothetical protein